MNFKIINSFIILLIITLSTTYSQTLTSVQEADIEKNIFLLEKAKSQNNKNQTLGFLNKIGQTYQNAGISDKAITYYLEALPISESLNNKTGTMNLNNFIGTCYQDLEKYDEAEKYFQAGLTYATANLSHSTESSNKENCINSYLRLAYNQYNQKKYDEALTNLKQSEILALELNSTAMLKKIYGRMAECYLELGNKDEYSRLFTLSNNLMAKEKAEFEAIAITEKANAEKNSLQIQLQNAMMNNLQDSMEVIEIQNEKSKTEITLLESAKKLAEAENLKKEAEVKEQKEKLKKNRIIFLSFLIGFGILILFIFIVLKFLNDKRKANSLLENMNKELNNKNVYIQQKNLELEEKNNKIETQNLQLETMIKELNNKNQQIESQRDMLEQKNNQITESISYASKIQKAILPSQKAIFTTFKDALIYYRPRDIVSGDFYWFTKQYDFDFIAAVDCTGHSVPGAFMSMIGNTLLNEIINEKNIFDPAAILTKLHEGIIRILHQQDNEEDATDDGMDITLCRYNKKAKQIVISSANHQVFKYNAQGNEIIEGDIFSIGGQISDEIDFAFKNNIIEVDDQTYLYFFSDGFPDQFGGTKGRKFMTEQFYAFITEIHTKPMDTQYKLIDDKFESWKGNRRQIDDILVIGIKF